MIDMKVGFVQMDAIFGETDRNIEKVAQLLSSYSGDLVVLPEFFNTGYLFTSKEEAYDLSEEIPSGKTVKALCELASAGDTYIVAGLPERSDHKLFNSAVLISPKGYVDTYRKMHLFNEEKLWFAPGDKGFSVYDIGHCRIGIMICFDWFFPESMRILSLKGADIICHPANLVLPFCQDAMTTRCLENRVYAITANRTGTEERGGKTFRYTGKSQITGPQANIIHRAGEMADEIGLAEIDITAVKNKSINPYNDLFRDRRVEFYGELTSE
jgi:predicted amidohydrolase